MGAETRRRQTPDDFHKFNGPTAILVRCDPASPIAVTGQTIACAWWISHFGHAPLAEAKLNWTLREGENLLASGSLDHLDVAVGDVRELGLARLTIPALSRPVHAVLEARLEGVDVDNQWDLWLFPKRMSKSGKGMAASAKLYGILSARYPGIARLGTPEGDAAEVLVAASCDADTLAALKAGRRVVTLESTGGAANVSLGWWWLGNRRVPQCCAIRHGQLSPRGLPFTTLVPDRQSCAACCSRETCSGAPNH